MTATSHAVIGTIIAAKIGNPALAIPIAMTSHIAADLIPHWDTGTNGHSKGKASMSILRNSVIDVLLGFILSYLLIYYFFPQTNLSYAFLIIIMSQLFDWLMIPYYFFGIKKPLFKSVYKFQKLFDNRLDKPWGIISQAVTVLLLLIIAIMI